MAGLQLSGAEESCGYDDVEVWGGGDWGMCKALKRGKGLTGGRREPVWVWRPEQPQRLQGESK